MNNELSAQPCGCDPGCHNHLCDRHQKEYDAQSTNRYPRGLSFVGAGAAGLGPISPPGDRYDEYHVQAIPVAFRSDLDTVPGLGGGPTRASILPTEPSLRKQFPVASGVLDYFPDALAVLSNVSWQGNEQHNPGQPLHWARGKSADEADTMIRHFLQRGTLDSDGLRHTAKMAWRALALLQKELECEST